MKDGFQIVNIIRIMNCENWVKTEVLYVRLNREFLWKFFQMRFNLLHSFRRF